MTMQKHDQRHFGSLVFKETYEMLTVLMDL